MLTKIPEQIINYARRALIILFVLIYQHSCGFYVPSLRVEDFEPGQNIQFSLFSFLFFSGGAVLAEACRTHGCCCAEVKSSHPI